MFVILELILFSLSLLKLHHLLSSDPAFEVSDTILFPSKICDSLFILSRAILFKIFTPNFINRQML